MLSTESPLPLPGEGDTPLPIRNMSPLMSTSRTERMRALMSAATLVVVLVGCSGFYAWWRNLQTPAPEPLPVKAEVVTKSTPVPEAAPLPAPPAPAPSEPAALPVSLNAPPADAPSADGPSSGASQPASDESEPASGDPSGTGGARRNLAGRFLRWNDGLQGHAQCARKQKSRAARNSPSCG